MQPFNLSKTVDLPGFMLAADTIYFNKWAKYLFFSIKKYAPWAHVHFHIFDPSQTDLSWVNQNDCSCSWETTPSEYCSDNATKVLYWAAARYMRVTEIYTDSTPVINLDVDSVMVTSLSQEQFIGDLKHSWVPTAPKRETRSLCSAIGFAPDNGRYAVRQKLYDVYKNSRLTWALDQHLCDELLDTNELQPMDLRYTDYKMRDDSYIWTGKGDRVYKNSFQTKISQYARLL